MKKVYFLTGLLILIYALMNISSPVSNMNAAPLFSSPENIWHDVDAGSVFLRGERLIIPTSSRALRLDMVELKKHLTSAPLEENISAKNSPFIVSIPMPDGSINRFSVVESPIMEYGLAIQFPEFKTYSGQGIDDPAATVRFSITSLGYHAMILSPNGDVFIDPYTKNETEIYQSYYKKDFRSSVDKTFLCHTESENITKVTPTVTDASTGENLRTYRLAVAATGEYTAFFGGTAAGALAAITVSVNRISGVYEKDLSVRLMLIANELLIIYTNGGTDPYTNNNGNTMLAQNQANVDAVIGSANYDVGHVYSTWSGGGIANLSCVCVAGQKARGVTGSPSPVGDPWDIDYVAHEMGHQFSGNHTQNNLGCNANPGTAWEPGSGITIMGYAGVCSPSLANNSIPIFHGGSIFDEMVPFTQFSSGNSCPVNTPTGNTPPTVNPGLTGLAIPISTPFSLTGSATDPNVGDALTYCWEQVDVGPQGPPNSPSGDAPLFRSFNPVATGNRVFPKISDIVNNTQTLGELLPNYSRNLTFRLTVRDNRAGGGGVAFNTAAFTVESTAGPFLVTAPNSATTWEALSNQTVTWNVANTTAAPVSCANVNILLSTDGGLTYPVTVLANTPNDGSQSVVIPNNVTTTARIKVESVGNIFFDISNANFTITPSVGIQVDPTLPLVFSLDQNFPNPFNPSTFINYSLPYNSNITLEIYDLNGKLVQKLIGNEFKTAGNYSIEFDGSRMPSGIYYYRITSDKNVETRKMILVK